MEPIDITDTFVRLNSGQVFVRRYTPSVSAGSYPIVMLHDSLGSTTLWRNFPEMLAAAAGRTVITYDRLGYGRSTHRTKPIPFSFIEDEATVFLPKILRLLGIKEFVALGHSIGGTMALTSGARNENCKAVISIAAQVFTERRTIEGVQATLERFTDRDTFAKLLRHHGQNTSWVLDSWKRVWLSKEFENWDLFDVLKEISCPVLCIHGDNDEFGSVAFPQRIEQLSGGPCETAIFEDCGHSPHREHPERTIETITKFLNRFAIS